MKEKKDEFNINKIYIYDNSIFLNKNSIMSLSIHYTLLHGENFYNKYGFVYINEYDLIKNKDNKKIIKKSKICNTTLFTYIFKKIKNRENRIDFYNKYSELTIKEFFNKFYNECFIDSFDYCNMYNFLRGIGIYDLDNKWMKLDLN